MSVAFIDADGKARTVSASNPLPTTGGAGGSGTMTVGGKYNTTAPTLSDGQKAELQLDQRGNLEVSLWTGNTPIAAFGDSSDGIPATATSRGLITAALSRVCNGTTWDRLRGTVAGIWMGRTSIYSETATVLAASGTLNGASRDSGAVAGGIGTRFKNFVAEVFTDQAGTLYIDKSTDGTTWRQAATASVAAGVNATLEVKITCRYYRLRYVNGATAQTVFLPTTAYTS
ncbi:hypothetical protein SPS_19 [Sphingomonas phage Scott]|uniref:Uncharacterized protein n=1 Tax=Sphingomonas phage Scott TaxID=2282912 RepID=A0A346FDB6_9CAUD|nr:hypothetical protein HOT83_gp19 [Sphingomonas phage Scott]AXN53730.1 hypothetical protein SPS_19 [Sphingomonas phage Scott]